jgi:glutaredoxin
MFGIKYMEVYGRVTCPYCAKAVDFLKAAGVEFVLSLVDQAPSRWHEISKITGRQTVPLIFEHKEDGSFRLIGGYDNMVAHMRIEYGIEFRPQPEVKIEIVEDDVGELPEGEE